MPALPEDQNDKGQWKGTAPVAPADSNPLMSCGYAGPPSVNTPPLMVQAGETLTAQYLHDRNIAWNVRDNANHHGFTLAYLAPFESGGQGKVFTKIFQDGLQAGAGPEQCDWYNPASTDACVGGGAEEGCQVDEFVGCWATDKMRLAGGKFSFPISKNTPPGKYLLRVELLTTFLPGTVDTAQSYLGCVAVQIGSGADQSQTLPQIAAANTIDIPGGYVGATWMHYNLRTEYASGNIPPAPGPPVWGGDQGSANGVAAASGSLPQAPPASATQAAGGQLSRRRKRHGRTGHDHVS